MATVDIESQGPATLKGNRLSIKAKCPTKVNATCTITLQGMLSRKKAATGGTEPADTPFPDPNAGAGR